MYWLETTPLYVIGFLIVGALAVAEILGFGARRLATRLGAQATEGVDYIQAGALALLGLLIAFTFSAAADRYDTRRHLVVEEANAIGTTYLRAQALEPAPRAALSGLMLRYAHVRSAWLRAPEGDAPIARVQADTDALQAKIWDAVADEVRAHPTATINPSLMQTTNEMIDLSASLRAAFDARLPIAILRAMIAYALISAAIMGYGPAARERQPVISAALYLGLAVSLCLILDLDRPRSGTVVIPQAAMDRAVAGIDAAEQAKTTGAPPAPASTARSP